MNRQVVIPCHEISQVGEVRRQATKLAEQAGLSAEAAGRAAIVGSELATNLVRYAQRGEMILRMLSASEPPGLELVSMDRGPGIPDLPRSLTDGFSTGGTHGNGLGAVRRLSSEFDIYSLRPNGTVAVSYVFESPRPRNNVSSFRWGVVQAAAPGELMCGDAWDVAERENQLSLMIADGLGHGPLAAEAAQGAVDAFCDHAFSATTEYLTHCDRRLRGTRGAAVAIAQIDCQRRKLAYAGVGNVAAQLRSRLAATGRGLVSHNGTVGVEVRRSQQFDYDCPDDALLVMYSDGLQSRWSLEAYPGLVSHHPALIAATLYRDFTRGRDDVTVCVVRCSSTSS